MNIILGATGQIGSTIVDHLTKKGLPVRAVIRNEEKADELIKKGAEVATADYFDLEALKNAVRDGKFIFLLTPETGKSSDILGDTKRLLENYRKAIENSDIDSIIGLSSIGAQFNKGTGNLLMSNMLEHELSQLKLSKVIVRAAYYYSNWLMSIDMVKEGGVLLSFYPTDLKFNMISPYDVAEFIAEKIGKGVDQSELIEIVGPEKYSPKEIAQTIGRTFNKEVKTHRILREKWNGTMKQIGFSDDATKNFVQMTELVANGKAEPEGRNGNPVSLSTTFAEYLNQTFKN